MGKVTIIYKEKGNRKKGAGNQKYFKTYFIEIF